MACLHETRFRKLTFIALTCLASACGGGSGNNPGSDGPAGTGACAQTTMLARLPACSAAATASLQLAAGCTPTSDGTLHQEEWADATCFALGASGDVMYAKYAGDKVYLAFSATPACGCGMAFAFDPDGGTTLDGDEFAVDVFDDPFNPDGDRADFVASNGTWVTGTAPTGVKSACPGQTPNPINYEFEVPFSALGIMAGTAHTFRFAVNHPNGGSWPAGVTEPANPDIPNDPSNWGQISSASAWR